MIDQIIHHHKPLAYILGWMGILGIGSQPFYPLAVDLLVKPPILVPRPETEHWVLHLSQTILSSPAFYTSGLESSMATADKDGRNRPKFRILDIGTGSGCIALGLTQSLLCPEGVSLTGGAKGEIVGSTEDLEIEAVAIDQSDLAVELAKENVSRCKLDRQVSIHRLDLFSDKFVEEVKLLHDTQKAQDRETSGEFDLVVSNPPYITRREYEELDLSVKKWEDRKALVGETQSSAQPTRPGISTAAEEDDGLVFYTRTISVLDGLLRQGKEGAKGGRPPNVAFEVGKGQAQRVASMLRTKGFKAEIVSDPWGVERAVFGWKP